MLLMPSALFLVFGYLMDMIRTAVNVSDDSVVSNIITESNGKLDFAICNDSDAGMVDTHDSVHIPQPAE